MGKLLDLMKQTASRRPNGQPRPVDEPERVVESDDLEEEIPFIEVGPNKSLEASASVLSHTPPPAPPPPAPAADTVVFRPALAEAGGPRRPRFAPEIVAFHEPDHPVSTQYRDLMTAVLASAGPPPRVLLFATTRPDADAGGVVLNLAVVAARAGRHVAVVDASRRPPGVAERLGLPERPGLTEVLFGATPLDRAVQSSDLAHLSLLAAGGSPPGGGVRFAAETVRSVLRQLRQRLDLVLVRGPFWDGPDAAALGAACDAVYLVVAAADAGSPQLDDLVQSLPNGVRLAGYVLSGEDWRPAA
jgi:Mrp family chromosome partitioning ATPase